MTNEDERMDRARRIREMREGTRPAEEQETEQQDADGNSESTDESAAPNGGQNDDVDAANDVDEGGDGEAAREAAEPDETALAESGDSDDNAPAGLQIPGAEIGDVSVDPQELAQQAGLETAESVGGDDETAAIEDQATNASAPVDGPEPVAGSDGDDRTPMGAAGSRATAEQATSTTETRVLEFNLGPERYCLDIDYVEEIVKRETVTRVPNTPDYVEGVVDLRGQITTILDPKVLLDIDADGSKELIVVFDPDDFEEQGAIGWVVDDVNRVTPIAEEEVNDSPVDQDHINGVVDRDDEFVIWTSPKVDIEDATG